MVNKGEPNFDFVDAPDGSYSIDSQPHPKSGERKEPNFDFKIPEQPVAVSVDDGVKENKTDNTPDSTEVAKANLATELNKSVDKVRAGDVSSLKSGKVVYGAAADGMKNKWKQNFDANFKNKPFEVNDTSAVGKANIVEDKIIDVSGVAEQEASQNIEAVRKLENRSDEKETAEYKEARAEWLKARERSNVLGAEFNQKYEAYLQEQAKENSFKKGWRATRKWLGLKPQLSEELVKLGHAAEIARQDYFAASNKIKEIRLDGVEATVNTVREERPVIDALRETTVGPIDDSRRLMDRYGSMLAYKLVIGTRKEQQAIQERVVGSFPESATSKRIKSTLETMRKYRVSRWTATAVGYGVLAGATGGLGLGVLAGGGYAVRVVGAVGLGGYFGTKVRAAGEKKVSEKEWELLMTESRAGYDLFERGFTETNAEIERLTGEIESAKAKTRTRSAAAAVGFGLLGGGLGGAVADNLEFAPSGIDTKITPGSSNHADLNQPSGGGEAVSPGNGGETVPQGNNEEGLTEEYVGPDHEPNEDEIGEEYEHDEDIFAEPAVTHTVERGDNAWNIMEGKGPDNDPVGGKSEVLKGMSLADRRYWLDRIFDYCDQNPEFAKEVGAVKSGGNIHLVHPGETINVSMLDEKIVELMNQEAGNNIPRPDETLLNSPAPSPDVTGMSEAQNTPTPVGETVAEQEGTIIVKSPLGEDVVINRVSDVNQMNLKEAGYLYSAANASDPNALRLIEEMGMDRQSYIEMYDSLGVRGEYDADMTVSEWMNQREASQTESVIPNDSTPRNEIQPDIDQRGELDSLSNDDPNRFREASFTPEAVNDNVQQAVQSYVNRVEGGSGMFDWAFGNNKVGTFEKIADLNFGQIKEFAAGDNMQSTTEQLGVTAEGYEKWMSELQGEVAKTPALSDNETLRQYLTRINTVRVAA